jgi:uncharacterized protein (DUF1697 family)
MPRYAAFLRGVNVGKHRRVSGEQLRAYVAELGFADVASFRTSGNVVFGAEQEPEEALVARVEAGLANATGLEIRVLLRTGDEIRAIAAHEPFPAEQVAASAGKLQVSLLATEPSAAAREQVLAMATPQDLLAIRGRELYWLPSGGLLESPLELGALARLLGLSTQRTKGTMDLIAAKFFAD